MTGPDNPTFNNGRFQHALHRGHTDLFRETSMPGARDHHAGQFIGVCSAGRAGRVMGSGARHVAVLEVGTRLPGSGLDRREDPASQQPGQPLLHLIGGTPGPAA
jgi:hypothetical protein